VGRSVYQRALFPLKSFIQSMVTDYLVIKKSGVLIAKLKQAGSIIDNIMSSMAGMKRQLLKQARTADVISISTEEEITSVNLQNLEGPMGMARKNILENIAIAADMPAKLLNQETFAEGFGEGTEDAKAVERYIKHMRSELKPLYDFFDEIVKYRAWNPSFYKAVQKQFPEEYGKKSHTQAFYEWNNSFRAVWPNLREEPDSEKVKVDKERFDAMVSLLETLRTDLDPENKARLIEWSMDNINDRRELFSSPLTLDIEALKNYEPPQDMPMPGEDDKEFGAPRPKT
jgi:hypothetical protein